ncbi:bifunctional 4-hydroxy-2-oxoglutarate aldolase/2-dehydro-3-deoxy-phosphogluconate aldolase [Paenarthrobacter sp. Z7-10]|uniref:bifunctional 4-hydroxy-2-oxoglutarate aldolase/2-dehydro-3-deoxy-phosphogluconate aldolase n=1 Tax=Paenarthrobacter sp. Z7-10 TaxID=2787635 RepID=UPI0022A9D364|nr:bifunctional 4-hydroxy-2-oxoglutarate aldolase/2-dehydro-3-deoxy-phosphogluconate aldolase [Paenarthrobacter sp. Z7-10]MCZ2403387.1 bifunctional 4-hydroxy-2-oxoglutarate aldolase/2-dehydro-3-deoxy-phosphogluconate aldolase [Paenarthrobacter sp. Z7-10]
MTDEEFIARLAADRSLVVVRAPVIPDAAQLCQALADGGIRSIELTFTTPDVLRHLSAAVAAADGHGAVVGVGTILTADQARAAVDAGAQFLVTPGLRPAVAKVAVEAGIPLCLGAMTPTEVAQAMDLGSAVVKIFPARQLGPAYLKDLQGPYPGVQLLPSGGISAANALDYLNAGAVAVCCGTSVVPPAAVAEGKWSDITARATAFTGALN